MPGFDPRSIPALGIDAHLTSVAPQKLTAQALRARFKHPPAWTPEHLFEAQQIDRTPVLAAVLLPLVMRKEPTVLLTERTSWLSNHSGQIAFPGGRTDACDSDPIATALREAEEEIGLTYEQVKVLGTLPTYLTGTGFLITPVVALVEPGFAVRPHPQEVANVFEVPLGYLMNPTHHYWHEAVSDGVMRRWISMPYSSPAPAAGTSPERYIWGATAAILRNLYRFLSA